MRKLRRRIDDLEHQITKMGDDILGMKVDIEILQSKANGILQGATGLSARIRSLSDEMAAVQQVLGINPHAGHNTVADRIAAIEDGPLRRHLRRHLRRLLSPTNQQQKENQ